MQRWSENDVVTDKISEHTLLTSSSLVGNFHIVLCLQTNHSTYCSKQVQNGLGTHPHIIRLLFYWMSQIGYLIYIN